MLILDPSFESMTILVTGAKGQMGNDFQAICPQFPHYRFSFTDIEELDITDEKAVGVFFHQNHPDVIINCAAYTAVDKAEQESEIAMKINGEAVGILARAASEAGTLMIQISTDYIFDGNHFKPYTEEDIPHPISTYSRSKYSGELAMHQYSSRGIIIRTSWLYSSFGHNFVKTMLKVGAEKGTLRVVFDQIGTPTWSRDLCRTILQILPKLTDFYGVDIYHYSDEGVCSWYDFAIAILELSGIHCHVNPISTKDYPLPAIRPFYSVFNKEKIKKRFDIQIPHWRESLKECIGILTRR